MKRLRTLATLLVLGAIILVVWRTGLYRLGDREQLAAAMARVRALGAAKVVFVGAYAIATAVGIPASPFTLAGGVLFGAWWGMALNWTGAMLGASLGYALASSLRDPMLGAPASGWRVRLAALGGAHGGWMLFRLRAIPVVPFALLNVGSAIVRMPWRRYLAATAAGIVPVTVVYTLFAASTAAGAAGGAGGGGHRALVTALVTGAGVVALSFLPRLLGARRLPDDRA